MTRWLLIAGMLVASVPAAHAQQAETTVLEIRTYNLKPGTREEFHRVFVTRVMPLLEKCNVDIVAYGPSIHDEHSWFLMRSYPTLEELRRSEDAFYGSVDWRQGPRDAILAAIETYATVVMPVHAATLRGLRNAPGR